jgi:hypothetical protein
MMGGVQRRYHLLSDPTPTVLSRHGDAVHARERQADQECTMSVTSELSGKPWRTPFVGGRTGAGF